MQKKRTQNTLGFIVSVPSLSFFVLWEKNILFHDDAHSLGRDESHPLLPAVSGSVRGRLKAWSSAGRRGLRFVVGAGVCLGRPAARGVACVWAPWGVLGGGLRSA